ncbi:MAG: CoA-binding protein [Hyphomicrobium sp.]|uniref:CoA-binding protein n=1 Tax=Hyphomicrobium sp. TaxID=82 RepID=UPI003D0C6159
MEPRLTFVTLGVKNLARARAFYEKLGFKPSSASTDEVAFYDAGGVVLALWGRSNLAGDAGVASAGSGFRSVAVAHNVRAEGDVARVLAEAKAAGGKVIKPSEKAFWGGQSGYFADPDGHLWEVAYNPFMPLDAAGRVMLPPAGPPAGMSDAAIAAILKSSRTFAVVGASDDPGRPSYGVMSYLKAKGYKLIPVNPTLAGKKILGASVRKDLAAIRTPVDVVDIFRRPDAALEVVRAAIRLKDRLKIKTIWMQLGVINEEAAAEARAAGLAVVMDRCPKIEYARLIGV